MVAVNRRQLAPAGGFMICWYDKKGLGTVFNIISEKIRLYGRRLNFACEPDRLSEQSLIPLECISLQSLAGCLPLLLFRGLPSRSRAETRLVILDNSGLQYIVGQ